MSHGNSLFCSPPPSAEFIWGLQSQRGCSRRCLWCNCARICDGEPDNCAFDRGSASIGHHVMRPVPDCHWRNNLRQFCRADTASRIAVKYGADFGLGPFAVVTIIIALYIVMGCFLEGIGMMLITVPVFLPIITGYGYDPSGLAFWLWWWLSWA